MTIYYILGAVYILIGIGVAFGLYIKDKGGITTGPNIIASSFMGVFWIAFVTAKATIKFFEP